MKITYELSEIDAVADQILKTVNSKTLLFQGEMGAGKTTLIKALAKKLNVFDITASPTYGFVNVYESETGETINHFDFYRLNSEEEAYDIGIEEYFYGNSWNFIEWPSKAISIIPEESDCISIEKINENERVLIIGSKEK
ncbi:tRNA threonylcarbamoyladenosine biosynthesis protein TsaE [Pustulibacterium marinum]|uniref:tRNA threonylcarbamoyladenosine biosynthesis protein TsaE n=1 Tax=Pustulibacterium marinum TaxID=1224947 RepID=A0A1I7IGR1_9FLAO|nr:tRNA (adenosine(37)-N6)-threonylcarbamoyltransferase complex ATPase subunit type 1 TsaE [Pustulibacterium marinum]SFU72091.1 tRNA threonylcarbamoyladenosine biosynthesis protein TsaE [Pustulibacterium marinum]